MNNNNSGSFYVCLLGVFIAAIVIVPFMNERAENPVQPKPAELKIGSHQEMVGYCNSEFGTVVEIHELPGTPSGHIFKVYEVAVTNDHGKTFTRPIYVSGNDKLQKGDHVQIQVIHHQGIAGGQYIRFGSKVIE